MSRSPAVHHGMPVVIKGSLGPAGSGGGLVLMRAENRAVFKNMSISESTRTCVISFPHAIRGAVQRRPRGLLEARPLLLRPGLSLRGSEDSEDEGIVRVPRHRSECRRPFCGHPQGPRLPASSLDSPTWGSG